MRIALCISGELRTFNDENVIKNLNKYIIDDLSPDIFISTWEHVGYSYHQNNNLDKISSSFLTEDLYKIYKNIKSINIENFDTWLYDPENENLKKHFINWKLHGGNENVSIIPSFYKLYDCYKMKKKYEDENNFKYDIVLRLRPDLFFVNFIKKDILQNIVYHNNFGTTGWYWPNRIYDIFFYSDSHTFDIICKAWLNLESLLSDNFDNGCGRMDACRTLYLQSVKNNIKVESINYRICEVYRKEDDIDSFIKLIKQFD